MMFSPEESEKAKEVFKDVRERRETIKRQGKRRNKLSLKKSERKKEIFA